MLWKRYSDFSRPSLKNVPLDLQKINVEIHISTFTLLLASFSGKLSHQQLTGGFSLETKPNAKQKKTRAKYLQLVWAQTQDETRGRCQLLGALLETQQGSWGQLVPESRAGTQDLGSSFSFNLPGGAHLLPAPFPSLHPSPSAHPACLPRACLHAHCPGVCNRAFWEPSWVHPSLQVKQDLTAGDDNDLSLPTPDAKL